MAISSRLYLIICMSVVVVIGTTTAIINYIMDPVWNFGGNKLFPENYSFNERLTKTNIYLKNSTNYDCIVFGSSTATLLDSKRIRNHQCFNYSVSAGTPPEFIQIADYILHHGTQPKLIIVGVDSRNFSRSRLKNQLPEFVADLGKPVHPYKLLFSLDTLDFSIKTFLRNTPRPRYYTDLFDGDILANTAHYEPSHCFNNEHYGRPFNLRNLRYYSELREKFPESQFLGYVPPISAWDMATIFEDGTMDSYLDTIYHASREFDLFFDFAIPSPITRNASLTYDGHHYQRAVNNLIGDALNGEEPKFGLKLNGLSKKEYKSRFIFQMELFAHSLSQPITFSEKCQHESHIR